ncbi:MAG TPA: hypothetical protein VF479_00750 [Pseudolysinimonas sp.]
MAGDRDAEVDPRFDPVFQRGYDPALHGGRRARTTARHATGPIPIASPRQPLAPVAAEPAEPTAPAETTASPDVAEHAAPGADADVTRSTRNPFRLALLIVSIVAIAAAAWMIWNRVGEDVYYGGFSGTNQGLLFRSQLFAALPVPLLTGGILGVILWLAIGAMAHRRDREGRDAEE